MLYEVGVRMVRKVIGDLRGAEKAANVSLQVGSDRR